MHKRNREPPVNRFSIVDVIIDVLLLATTFTVPLNMPDFLSRAEAGFLENLGQLVVLFIGYFGLALYVARMYAATAIKNDNKWTHKVLFPTTPLVGFTWLIVINVLFSTYSIFQMIEPPVFTSLLLIVEALAFGFTFGLDYAIEWHRSLDPKNTVPPDNKFSQSFSSLPYLILTIILLFPLDYFSLKFEFPVVGRIVTIVGSCTAIYFLSNLLNRTVFSKLRLTSAMGFATVALVSFLLVIGFMGLDVLEAFPRHQVVGTSVAATIAFLFFFGIVPLRLGTILFSRTAVFNRILGLIALVFYLLVQTGLLQFSWLG